MFRLPNPDESLPTEVTVLVPTAEGVDERTVTLAFRPLPTDEVDALARQGDAELLAEVITSWDGVCGTDGEVLPCTRPHRLLVGRIACFARAAVAAYMDRIAPAKNS